MLAFGEGNTNISKYMYWGNTNISKYLYCGGAIQIFRNICMGDTNILGGIQIFRNICIAPIQIFLNICIGGIQKIGEYKYFVTPACARGVAHGLQHNHKIHAPACARGVAHGFHTNTKPMRRRTPGGGA